MTWSESAAWSVVASPVTTSSQLFLSMRRFPVRVLLVLLSIATLPARAVAQAPRSSPDRMTRRVTRTDSVACRAAAIDAVRLWFHAVSSGDTAAVRRAVSPTFGVISAGRNGWPEPFFRGETMDALMDYVRRRGARHERIGNLAVPLGAWRRGRLMLGVVSYTRTADDITGTQHWLGKGAYECGRGIHVLNTAPQGRP
jgi:hypothetical protein